jgi:Na+/proline symporter
VVLHSRIIHSERGVFGYTYGSLLGVFLVGALTKTRGSDRGNLAAMIAGGLAVIVVGELPHRLDPTLPKLAFPWFVLVGTLVTAAVAAAFRTPKKANKFSLPER